MPDRDVRTIRELIFSQYAKIIAKRALAGGDAAVAKHSHYDFIRTTSRDLPTAPGTAPLTAPRKGSPDLEPRL